MTASFRSAYFVATATAIPVLWIAIGFASSAITSIMRRLREVNATISVRPGLLAPNYTLGPTSLTVSLFGASVEVIGVNTSGVLRLWFALIVLFPGAAGEVLSLLALIFDDRRIWVLWVVFGAVCVLIGVTLSFMTLTIFASVGNEERGNDEIPGTIANGAPISTVGERSSQDHIDPEHTEDQPDGPPTWRTHGLPGPAPLSGR